MMRQKSDTEAAPRLVLCGEPRASVVGVGGPARGVRIVMIGPCTRQFSDYTRVTRLNARRYVIYAVL